jgi:hypothetical protein
MKKKKKGILDSINLDYFNRSNPLDTNISTKFGYRDIYFWLWVLFTTTDVIFTLIILSPLGKEDGFLRKVYEYAENHIDQFTNIVFFILFIDLFFPISPFKGLTFFALYYRLAIFCCRKVQKNNESSRESFGDGFPYGRAMYHPDRDTVYSQGCLEKEDSPEVVLFPRDGCSDGWVIPKIMNQCQLAEKLSKGVYCPVGCGECSLAKAGSILRNSVKARGLRTTSLLAKDLGEN